MRRFTVAREPAFSLRIPFLVVLAAFACNPSLAGSTELARELEAAPDEGAGRAAISRTVAVGLDLDQGRKLLQDAGFGCREMANEIFADHVAANYTYCDASFGSLVARRWQVALYSQAGRITEVAVTTGLVSP